MSKASFFTWILKTLFCLALVTWLVVVGGVALKIASKGGAEPAPLPVTAGRLVVPEPPRQELPSWFKRNMRVTAYCGGKCCCGRWADGVTASGKPITANRGHFVAASSDFPFGTRIKIPGYAEGRPVPVLDRGGAIKGNRLDVFFADDPGVPGSGHQRALEWGVQELEVEIERSDTAY